MAEKTPINKAPTKETKDKEAKQKVKRPSAIKSAEQSEKKRAENKVFKSRVTTAVRALEKSLLSKDQSSVEACLKEVHSLMDKGVKRGIYKLNKARRTKSRLTTRTLRPKA